MSSADTSSASNSGSRNDLQVLQIKKAFMDILKEQQSVPTIAQLAERMKLSKRQVQRHFKKVDWKEMYGGFFKSHTPEVITALLLTAKKGNVAAIKLWMQLVEGWIPITANDFTSGGQPLAAPTIELESIDITDETSGNKQQS